MTITGRNVTDLERTCATVVKNAKENDFRTKGPVRIPNKNLHLSVRRSPCGEGSNTWDHFEMKIHKRVIDVFCPVENLKDITTFKLDSGVSVTLNVNNLD